MRVSIIALLVVLVAGVSRAQEALPDKGAGKPNPFLQKMDKDGDGQLDEAELDAARGGKQPGGKKAPEAEPPANF